LVPHFECARQLLRLATSEIVAPPAEWPTTTTCPSIPAVASIAVRA